MNDFLKCLVCGQEFGFYPNEVFCSSCGQPGLFINSVSRGAEVDERATTILEKFASLLPLKQVRPELSLGEGHTPLLSLFNLSRSGHLLAKLESANPTLSFKDRGSVLVMQKILEMGWQAVGTVSTGNMASSTAAYAARAGLKCVLLIKRGTSAGALVSSAVFNPLIIEFEGNYGHLFEESYKLGKEFGLYIANSIDPLRLEGYKLTAFELCLQLGRAPDYVYVPVSSGGHFIGLYKGFIEMKQAGYIEKLPSLVGVQAAACAPIARAFEQGQESVSKIQESETIAHSIANPEPPAGNLVLKLVRDNKGWLIAVTDEDMLWAQQQLAKREGLFVQPESAATLAAYHRLQNRFEGTSVLILTGQGLKAAHQPRLLGSSYKVTGIQELRELFSSVYCRR